MCCLRQQRQAFVNRLKACIESRDFSQGKKLHAQILASDYASDTYLANLLMTLYRRCRSLDDARAVFECIDRPTNYSWNIIIAACIESGELDLAGSFYKRMPDWDLVTRNTMLQAYAQAGHQGRAKACFDRRGRRDVISWNTMIGFFARQGRCGDANLFFDRMPQRSVVSWTTLLAAHAALGHLEFAAQLFDSMPECDAVACSAMLQAYASVGGGDRRSGDACREFFLHRMSHRDCLSWNTVIAALAGAGRYVDARDAFDRMPATNVGAWNEMIVIFSRNAQLREAVEAFDRMPERDVVSWNSVVQAFARNGEELDAAGAALERMPQWGIACWNCLLQELVERRQIDLARTLFRGMIARDVVSWTCMIPAQELKDSKDGIKEDHEQQDDDCEDGDCQTHDRKRGDRKTSDCKKGDRKHDDQHDQNDDVLGERDPKEEIEFFFDKMPAWNSVSWNTLIQTYAQAGRFDEARKNFQFMPQRNLVSWNVLTAAYAQSGRFVEMVEFFRAMLLDGVPPNDKTFTSVLGGCSQCGKVEDARSYFVSMTADFALEPDPIGYCCMLDLLGRKSFFKDLEELMRYMPGQPSVEALLAVQC